jgi:hypothetical protein
MSKSDPVVAASVFIFTESDGLYVRKVTVNDMFPHSILGSNEFAMSLHIYIHYLSLIYVSFI